MLSSFDHLTIVVRDVAAAAATYERLLGTAPLWRGEQLGMGTRAALFGFFNGLVELVGPSSDAPESEGLRMHLDARGEGLHGLTFATSDAEACSAALRARGLRATAPESGEARADSGELRRYRVVELSPASTRRLPIAIVERSAPLAESAKLAEDGAVFDALDHVVVRTADIDAALLLYRDGLGLRLALDRTFGDTRMLFFRIGGVTVEVVHDVGAGAQDALYGVAYRVRDIAAAHARLAASGFDVSPVRAGRKPDTQVFTVRGPSCGVPTLVLHDPARA